LGRTYVNIAKPPFVPLLSTYKQEKGGGGSEGEGKVHYYLYLYSRGISARRENRRRGEGGVLEEDGTQGRDLSLLDLDWLEPAKLSLLFLSSPVESGTGTVTRKSGKTPSWANPSSS